MRCERFVYYTNSLWRQDKLIYNRNTPFTPPPPPPPTHTHTHSFYAVYRITPIAYRMVYIGGWQHAICDYRSYVGSSGGGIWAFLFPFSKLPELVDTVFIVLRKQKMVFLHWYHHITGNLIWWGGDGMGTIGFVSLRAFKWVPIWVVYCVRGWWYEFGLVL